MLKRGRLTLQAPDDAERPVPDLVRERWRAVLEAAKAYKWAVRSERIKAGFAKAKAKGERFGPAMGSRKGRRLKATPEKVSEIMRLHKEGEGVSVIARKVGLSRTTIYSIIREKED